MGINKKSFDFIINSIEDYGLDLNNCRMVELGNQILKDGFRKSMSRAAKNLFQSIGIYHVSIDINGKNDALPIDLQQEIKDELLIKTFDVLTNSGTTEHVKSQYMCWLNIHNLVKQNGIFIHLVPRTGHWCGHGYHKYSLEFFEKLANGCGYEIIENFVRKSEPGKDFICCSMIKKKDNEFASNKVFNTFGILRG